MKIYPTGVLKIDFNDHNNYVKAQRLWVIFDNPILAEKFLMENQTDCFEHYYNYGLIEQHETNSLFKITKQWWFKLEISGLDFVSVRIECPEVFKNTVNWWVG